MLKSFILLVLIGEILLPYADDSMTSKFKLDAENRNFDPVTMNIILDIVKYQEKPTSLIAFKTYWNLDVLRKLAIQMSSLGSFFSTLLPEDDCIIHEIMILFDLKCLNSSNVITEANKNHMFRAPYRWILLQDRRSNNGEKYSLMETLDLLPDNEVLLLDQVGDESFDLSKMYKVSRSSDLIHQAWGSWSSGKLQVYNNSALFRRDLKKTPIIMSNVVMDSETTVQHLTDAMEPEYDSITKRSYMVVTLAIEMMNGTRVTTFTPTWGYQDEYGNWSGLTEQLNRGNANVGTASFVTTPRLPVVDFIAPSPTRVRFVFRRPPLSSVGDIYAKTFDGRVWSAIVIAVLAAAAVLFLSTKWENHVWKGQRYLTQMESKDTYLMATSAIFQQGCSVEPQRFSGRLATFVLFLSMMSLYAAYSAKIVVLLRATSGSIQTLEDLLNSRIAMATSNAVYNRYYFQFDNTEYRSTLLILSADNAALTNITIQLEQLPLSIRGVDGIIHQTEPVRKAIYEKKIAPPGVKPRFFSIPEGVNRLREGMFAFNMEVDVGYKHVEETFFEHEKCDLVEIDYINMLDPWIPIEKNSPYREMFRVHLKRIHEAGLQPRITSLLVTPKPSCSSAESFSSVSYIDFYPAIVWMLYGFALALLILLGEIIVYRRTKQSSSRVHTASSASHIMFSNE